MNALLTVVTLRDLNNNLSSVEDSVNASNQLMDERIRNLSDARRAAAKDPCDFNKARVQQATAELEEVRKDKGSLQKDLRQAREAVRIFAFKAKPALTASGKVLRH